LASENLDGSSIFSGALSGKENEKMKYRRLGNTGLIVSELALGTMQFGGKMNMGNLGQDATTQMVKLAYDRGINFVDTADVYSLGESETLLTRRVRE
jgi:aryl-alcohol dehydrogenase-like predicted oxidoreductase